MYILQLINLKIVIVSYIHICLCIKDNITQIEIKSNRNNKHVQCYFLWYSQNRRKNHNNIYGCKKINTWKKTHTKIGGVRNNLPLPSSKSHRRFLQYSTVNLYILIKFTTERLYNSFIYIIAMLLSAYARKFQHPRLVLILAALKLLCNAMKWWWGFRAVFANIFLRKFL